LIDHYMQFEKVFLLGVHRLFKIDCL
jgi:hypothetical protein